MNIKGKNFRIEGMQPYEQLLIIENREGASVLINNVSDAQILIDTLQKWVNLKDPFQQNQQLSQNVTLKSFNKMTQFAVFEIGSAVIEVEPIQGKWGIVDVYVCDHGGYTPLSKDPYQQYLPTIINKINDYYSGKG